MVIPVLILIDVEPDERTSIPIGEARWKGFEDTFDYLNRLRPRLEAATGSAAHFCWFLRSDPQIEHCYGSPSWVFSTYAALLQKLEERGDEIALHIHPWRWSSEAQCWIEDFADQQWVDQCVRDGFKAFKESRRSASFKLSFWRSLDE